MMCIAINCTALDIEMVKRCRVESVWGGAPLDIHHTLQETLGYSIYALKVKGGGHQHQSSPSLPMCTPVEDKLFVPRTRESTMRNVSIGLYDHKVHNNEWELLIPHMLLNPSKKENTVGVCSSWQWNMLATMCSWHV